MTENKSKLESLTGIWRKLLIAFMVTLSFGYGAGMYYLTRTSGFDARGIEQNYLGNEDDEDAEVMLFRKPEKEIISIIHSHAVSFALVFLSLGGLFLMTGFPAGIKKWLVIEPFVSVVITFGGIWLMWKGVLWMKYFILLSGILMNLAFVLMAAGVFYALLQKRKMVYTGRERG